MIFINAPIAIGKTSLAKFLSKDLGTHAFLEVPEKIPLLNDFYSDGKISRELKSFAVQIEFLDYRYEQLMQGVFLAQEGENNTVYDSSLISDATMSKNLYNRGEFPEILYKDYLRLNNVMQRNVSGHPFMGPDLIVYLEAPFEQMLENINKRGRKMETTDSKLVEYYKSVWNIYRDWYQSYGQTPVLKIDVGGIDFVNNVEERDAILNKIEEELVELGKLTQSEFEQIKAERAEKFNDPAPDAA